SSPLSRYKRTSSIRGAGGQMYVSAIGSSSAGAEVIVDYFVQSRRWQDTQCPGLTSRQAGASTRPRASPSGQRGWNAQPGGGFIGLGTSPRRMRFSRLSFGFGTGTAESSASV